MQEMTHDDVTISYSDEGAGRPVLLLHGHTLDRRIWLPVVPHLLKSGLRVIRPDLRGHGRSSRPDYGYHVSHHRADMTALLDHLEIDRATLVGFSFGGGVALEAAVTRAARVEALGLVAPVLPDRPFEPAFMDSLREVARSVRADGVEAAMTGPWMNSPLFAHSLAKPGVREAVGAIVSAFPGAEFLATRRDEIDREWTIPDRLGEIRCPTSVLVGECEMPGFRAYAEEIAGAVPSARFEAVSDSGHLLPLEAPDAVARMITDLVRRG
jgi:pimeloyl-ACP methyl ester carboxylesterase